MTARIRSLPRRSARAKAGAALAFLVAVAVFVGPPGRGHYVPQAFAQQRELDEDNPAIGPRAAARFTILQLNDVYSAEPVNGAGGLARVATLKRRVASEGRPALLLVAGDFLSPSVASSVFKGE